jgi:hypothetical protein
MLNLLIAWLLAILGSRPATPPAPARAIATPSSARAAQIRLASALGEATAIHRIRVHGRGVAIEISRGDRPYEVVVAMNPRTNTVTSVAMRARSRAATDAADLGWLADEMASVVAIVAIIADEDGGFVLATDDGRRYAVIPGRGSGGGETGNEAVSSRWAGEWDGP